VLGLLVAASTFVTGCADWSYDRMRIGMTQRECERAFAEDSFWRTDLGFCYLQVRPQAGRTDALVVLLARDQRVAGKLQATRFEPAGWLSRESGFRLRGELDPAAAALNATGPIDALRALVDDLTSYRGAKPALDAHAWVAAGLVRLMERWPHVGQEGPRNATLDDLLERVPGGGEARISVDRRGVYAFEYRQGPVR
jgi:hypothetical protein